MEGVLVHAVSPEGGLPSIWDAVQPRWILSGLASECNDLRKNRVVLHD